MSESLIAVGMIVMLSMGLESITGFGATILALPFLSMFIDVRSAVALMSMMSGMFGVYVFCAERRFMQRTVLKNILIFGGIGLPVGILLFSVLPERWLKLILGVFVTFSAVKALIQQRLAGKQTASAQPEKAECTWGDRIALLIGGVFHGAFAAGGPLFTLYVSRQHLSKSQFRATMTFVWVVFNAVLLIKNICISGIITTDFLKMWLLAIPFLIAGAVVGNFLHRRVSIRVFTLLTNLLLLIAGLSTLFTQLGIL